MRTTLAACAAACLFAVSPVHASDTAVELHYGETGSTSFRGVSLRFGEMWASESDNWKMTLQPVVQGGRFRYSGDRAERESVSYGGVAIGFRIARKADTFRPYFEAGFGGTYFGQTTLGPRSLSTRFQFTEWLGLGLELGDHVTLGWRVSHYSNGGIKKPNDGVDMQQIVLGVKF